MHYGLPHHTRLTKSPMDNKTMNRTSTVDALVIFVDARGFTSWAQKVEVFAFIDEFGKMLNRLLHDSFNQDNSCYIKGLGDGAMIVKELPEISDASRLKKLLLDTLKTIDQAEKSFVKSCKDLSMRYGSRVDLALGWGITRGHIKRIGDDYIGADINKCSRLCSIARPFGIVIDAEDFSILPRLPRGLDISLYRQFRKLNGIDQDIEVWVTKAIASQFIIRENLRESPEVHVAGICIKRDNKGLRVLVAKRASSRKLFPNLYEGCGGQLARNEYFTTGVRRHFSLELGIEVEVIEDVHKFYFIQQPNEHTIPGIKFLCVHKEGTPRSENHSEVKWVTEAELRSIPDDQFIQGLKKDFLDFITSFKEMPTRKRGSKSDMDVLKI